MATVDYFVHGRGRGHGSRARDAVPALEAAGHVVRVHAGGAAPAALGPIAGVRPREVVGRGLGGLGTWRRLFVGDLARFRGAERPDAVVSDGDAPSLAAARRAGVPAVAVGHDQVFVHAVLPAGLPPGPLWRERVHGSIAGRLAGRAVAVHFLPIAARSARARVARIAGADLAGPVSDDGFFVAYFRDPNADAVLDAAVAAGARVVAFGSDVRPRPGVEARGFDRAGLVAHLRRCRGVIGSAGSNLLAECVWLGKPVLAVHRDREAEQALNAAMIEAAGVGVAGPLGRLSPGDVARFVDRAGVGGFARVDLRGGLPALPGVLVEEVAAALAG